MPPRRPDPEPPPTLLTAKEVAHLLSIAVRTLHRLVTAGIVPAPVRITRKIIRWRVADIDHYLKGLPPKEQAS
ncbi:MAG: helix-turn-helix domain-containing protein [Planctomycetes bacterium]|nr:helix-turn-helix domain-containing protein [Planctomycetota bacterium]